MPTTWSSPTIRARCAARAIAYSFLPTLGESDLFLFGKGDERRIYEKLGAQLRDD